MAFSNAMEKLNAKIQELEERVDKLSSNEKTTNESGVFVYNKKFLNYQILGQKTLHITSLENKTKNQLFFQLKVKFFNYFSQDIHFKLFADKVLIGQETNYYNNGTYEIIIFGNYQNQVSDLIKIQLQVSAKDGKQVTLIETTLTSWGNTQESFEEYEGAETSTNIFLSYVANKQLHYKLFDKTLDCENFEFNFLDDSISHSVCVFNDLIYLFRVDLDGNLFFSKFLYDFETFISGNVSKVTCCSANSSIVFSYISSGKAYYGEIHNNVVISNNKINSPHGTFISCHLHHNAYNNKCYLLLTKNDKSNYLLESIPSSFSSSENICAEIALNISVT